MNPNEDKIYKEIENINEFTDHRTIIHIKESLFMRNSSDEINYPLFNLAREKGIIS